MVAMIAVAAIAIFLSLVGSDNWALSEAGGGAIGEKGSTDQFRDVRDYGVS